MVMEQGRTVTFVVTGRGGARYTVHARIRPYSPGSRAYRIEVVCDDGRTLTRWSRGVYSIDATSEIVTSDDPSAP